MFSKEGIMNLLENGIEFKLFLFIFLIKIFFISQGFSKELLLVDPQNCKIINFLQGDYENIKSLRERYILTYKGDKIEGYVLFSSLNEKIVIPFQNNLNIMVSSLEDNASICTQDYRNLEFKIHSSINEINLRNRMLVEENKKKSLFERIFFIIAIFLLIMLIIQIVHYIINLRKVKYHES